MTRATVLIADDDPDQHAILGLYLDHIGYRVLHAFDGLEAVELAQCERPEVVLMNIHMPRVDGPAAREMLAQRPETRDIPVVSVSADVVNWQEERARGAGFATHITKPADLVAVGRLVGRILAPHVNEPALALVAAE